MRPKFWPAGVISLSLLPTTGRYVRPCLGAAVGAIGAVCVAGAVGRFSGYAGFGAIALALAVYGVALVMFGVLDREEVRFVRASFSALSGRARHHER